MPGGLEANIAEGGGNLSVGQRQVGRRLSAETWRSLRHSHNAPLLGIAVPPGAAGGECKCKR